MVDPISVMKAINSFGKYLIVFVLLMNVIGISTASSQNISIAMSQLCETARSLLAVGAMLLIILAAAVYAIGQIVGAETRARASVWATAMITGAVIGIVIYLVVPNLISLLLKGTPADGANPCAFSLSA